MKRLMILAVALVTIETMAMPGFPRNEFRIGAMCVPKGCDTERHIKEIRDCNLDFLIGLRDTSPDKLALCKKYGIDIVQHVGAFHAYYHAKSAERKCEMLRNGWRFCYRQEAQHMFDKQLDPAIKYNFIIDEPGAYHYNYLAEICRYYNHKLPQLPTMINLLPIYAKLAEDDSTAKFNAIGASTYNEYVDLYCKKVPTQMISVDLYPVPQYDKEESIKCFELWFYENMQILADACRKYGREFWMIPQVNVRPGDVKMNLDILRHQLFASMAFGVMRICWACWTGSDIPGGGWWADNVLDKNGNITPVYWYLKQANAEAKALAPEFMKFRNIDTVLIGQGKYDEDFKKKGVRREDEFNDGFITGLINEDYTYTLVGAMMPHNNESPERAYFITPVSDPLGKTKTVREIRFNASGEVRVFTPEGQAELFKGADDKWAFKLRENSAALIVLNTCF